MKSSGKLRAVFEPVHYHLFGVLDLLLTAGLIGGEIHLFIHQERIFDIIYWTDSLPLTFSTGAFKGASNYSDISLIGTSFGPLFHR